MKPKCRRAARHRPGRSSARRLLDEFGGPPTAGRRPRAFVDTDADRLRARRTMISSQLADAGPAPRCRSSSSSSSSGGSFVSASVRKTFDYFDRNRSGFLDYRELRTALQHMGYDVSTGATIELLRAYDDYPDGKLELAEFNKLASDLNRAAGPVSASVRSAFDRFDKNRSGFLDYRELRTALKHMRYDVSTATTIELLRVRRPPGWQARRV